MGGGNRGGAPIWDAAGPAEDCDTTEQLYVDGATGATERGSAPAIVRAANNCSAERASLKAKSVRDSISSTIFSTSARVDWKPPLLTMKGPGRFVSSRGVLSITRTRAANSENALAPARCKKILAASFIGAHLKSI